jgi:Tol biopolymer transport system component
VWGVSTGLGGTNETGDLQPVWAPVGARIAFERWTYVAGSYASETAVWMRTIGPGGSLVGREGLLARDAWDPAWSPDGRRIVFARVPGNRGDRATSQFAGQLNPSKGLVVVGVANRSERLVPNTLGAIDPAWSPDGNQLAFAVRSRGIFVIGIDGKRRRQITHGFDSEPDWSPDGRQIVFAHAKVGLAGQLVTIVNRDGTGRRVLTAGASGSSATVQDAGAAPVWSPDGKTIAFVKHLDGSGVDRIYLIATTGSRLARPLTLCSAAHDCDDPSWSTNGKDLAYTDTDQQGHHHPGQVAGGDRG